MILRNSDGFGHKVVFDSVIRIKDEMSERNTLDQATLSSSRIGLGPRARAR